MKTLNTLAASAFALAAALPAPSGAQAAERTLVSRDGIEALVHGADWCRQQVRITLESSDPEADYLGDRVELQRFLGGVRAVMGFECPEVEALEIVGRAAGGTRELFSASLHKNRGWVMEQVAVSSLLEVDSGSAMPPGGAAPSTTEASPAAGSEPTSGGTPATGSALALMNALRGDPDAGEAVADKPVGEGPRAEPSTASPDTTPGATSPATSAEPVTALSQPMSEPAAATQEDQLSTDPEQAAQAPVQAADATTSSQPVGAITASWNNLLQIWLGRHPEHRDDPVLAQLARAQTECASFFGIARDPFRRAAWLREAEERLRDAEALEPGPLRLRVPVTLSERYDFDTRSFPLQLPANFTREISATPCSHLPERSPDVFPETFIFEIANPEVVQGLPLSPEEAEAVASRKARSVGLHRDQYAITFLLEVDEITDITQLSRADGRISLFNRPTVGGVTIQARILSYEIDDNHGQEPTLLHVGDPQEMAQREAVAEARRQEAEAARQAEPAELREQAEWALDEAVVARWFSETMARDDLIDEERVLHTGTRVITPASDEKIINPRWLSPFRLGSHTIVFRNASDFAGRTLAGLLSDEYLEENRYSIFVKADITVRPVGAVSDPLRGGDVLYLHIERIDLDTRRHRLDERPNQAIAPLLATSPVERLIFEKDERTARDIAVLGVHGGQTMQEVRSAISRALDQELDWSEDTNTLQTTGTACSAFEGHQPAGGFMSRPVPLETGLRCVIGHFVEDDAGTPRLAHLTFKQAVSTANARAASGAMVERYGEPAFVGQDGSPLVWGATLTDGRLDHAHQLRADFPTHALEVVFRDRRGGMAIVDMRLADELQLTEEERRAREAEALEQQRDAVEVTF